ncbi:FAS-associated factor 1-like [Anneissia japonica]|uniref:FAS-associated factor 1-like n=1 Tax=Anneissia japonica TaxID=1529436 RepID=UPI001425598E|nr:FAS-associated factor 1-like [Anneissia japonica]
MCACALHKMATNRDEILADFQACTGINDFEECLAHLEQSDWNLQQAVSSVLVTDNPVEDVPDTEMVDLTPSVVKASSISPSNRPCASTNFEPPPPRVRRLQFDVEYRDRTIHLRVEDSMTVFTVKKLLNEELKIPVTMMDVRGWSGGRVIAKDSDLLASLHLPLHNKLFLLTPDIPETDSIEENQNNGEPNEVVLKYELLIRDQDTGEEKHVTYPANKTIREVKLDVYTLTSVAVRHQNWLDWPQASGDDTLTLADCHFNYPNHRLTFCRVKENHSKPHNSKNEDYNTDSDEFEDAADTFDFDDDTQFFGDENHQTHKFKPLLPSGIEDPTEALAHFTHEFEERYGERHPFFFLGSLDDATKEAFKPTLADRKPLAIYLHHDRSVQVNVFCSQLLCAESIVSFLSHHFVTWAWDLTLDINKARLLNMCTEHFGSMAASAVRNIQDDQFPIILIVMKTRSNAEVFSVSQGNTSLDEMMTALVHSVDVFNHQRSVFMAEDSERLAAEQLRLEQDAAYQASLIADRAKAEEKERTEREEREKQEREDQERREKEQNDEAIRLSLEQQVLEEPPAEVKDGVSTLRMRLPDGEMLVRRFYANHAIKTLFYFIGSKGYRTEDYKLLTTWPKRDVTLLDSSKTFKDSGLFPQETLFVEERQDVD